MKREFWILLIVFLILANVVLYKVSTEEKLPLESNDSIGDSFSFENLRAFETVYFWVLLATIVVILFILFLSFIKRRTF
jgi:hypothetical protein